MGTVVPISAIVHPVERAREVWRESDIRVTAKIGGGDGNDAVFHHVDLAEISEVDGLCPFCGVPFEGAVEGDALTAVGVGKELADTVIVGVVVRRGNSRRSVHDEAVYVQVCATSEAKIVVIV